VSYICVHLVYTPVTSYAVCRTCLRLALSKYDASVPLCHALPDVFYKFIYLIDISILYMCLSHICVYRPLSHPLSVSTLTITRTHTRAHTHTRTRIHPDMVLLMDPARYKYPPVWVPLDNLYQSIMQMNSCGLFTRKEDGSTLDWDMAQFLAMFRGTDLPSSSPRNEVICIVNTKMVDCCHINLLLFVIPHISVLSFSIFVYPLFVARTVTHTHARTLFPSLCPAFLGTRVLCSSLERALSAPSCLFSLYLALFRTHIHTLSLSHTRIRWLAPTLTHVRVCHIHRQRVGCAGDCIKEGVYRVLRMQRIHARPGASLP